MDFRILALLIMTTLLFSMGLLVYSRNRKSIINISYSFFVVFMAFWSLGLAMFYISSEVNSMHFWANFLYLAGGLIASFFFYFSLVFPSTKSLISPLKRFLIFSPNIILFILFFFSDFILQGVVIESGVKEFVYGPGHILFDLQFSIFFLWGFYNLIQKYRKSIERARAQLRYIILGTSLGLIVAGTANVILPWFGNFKYLWLGPEAAAIWIIFNTYAIIKYRLMDIRLVVKRSTIFSLIVIAITAAYAMSAFLVGLIVFGGVYTLQAQIITGLIVALLVAIGFRPLYEWLKKTTDTFLFKGEYSPQELMADITDIVSRTLDLDVVIETLKEKITNALRIKKLEIVILKEDSFKKRKSLEKIADYFRKQRDVLVLEEMKRKYVEKIDSEKNLYLIKELEKLNIASAIPLLVKKKLVGIFLLGSKKSGDMFTNEDIKTLETIAGQAGIAIENARLYEEMKDFSKTLQKEVERQTKTLKDTNIRLKQLDVAKSEFISLASHQLRTPLTIIKGYVSMILEGTWGPVEGKNREQLKKIYSSNERLVKLVEDLLTVSKIESGRLEFDWKTIHFEDMVNDVVKEFNQMVKSKKLYLKFVKPKKVLSKIRIDSLKIRQVVQNLIDNAIHYTQKGGITIRLKEKKDKMLFSIKDTGIGILPEDQAVLFEKFSRGRDIGRIHTEGVGLGLYLSVKMVEAHKGKIWVESEGENKGSTFYFELPLKKIKK